MEQILYSQVIRIRRNDLKFVATDKHKIEVKFKFQGQSSRSQRWFDHDLDCMEVNFSTREPNFYKHFFQSYDDTQDINIFKFFQFRMAYKMSFSIIFTNIKLFEET